MLRIIGITFLVRSCHHAERAGYVVITLRAMKALCVISAVVAVRVNAESPTGPTRGAN
jgi:hypothetical protein